MFLSVSKHLCGDEFMPKLVGFHSDSASVNTGKKKRVKPCYNKKTLGSRLDGVFHIA